MAKTTLNPKQIDTTDMKPEEVAALSKLKAIDPFGSVDLFGENNSIKLEGINEFIDAAERTTIAINTIHMELHRPEVQEALALLGKSDESPNRTIISFVELIHSILHEIDRAKR